MKTITVREEIKAAESRKTIEKVKKAVEEKCLSSTDS
jgi:hypothetical protein